MLMPLKFSSKLFNKLQGYLFNLKFVLSANKTKLIIFSRAKDITDIGQHVTTQTGHSIERVSKYLGTWLDQKLTFKSKRQKIDYLCICVMMKLIQLLFSNLKTVMVPWTHSFVTNWSVVCLQGHTKCGWYHLSEQKPLSIQLLNRQMTQVQCWLTVDKTVLCER